MRHFLCSKRSCEMPFSCCAIDCVSRYNKRKGVKLFRVPSGKSVACKKKRRAWIRAIRRKNWAPNKHSRICSLHFISGRPSKGPNNLDYVPTIVSFTNHSTERDEETTATSRHDRYLRRQRLAMEPIQNVGTTCYGTIPTECDFVLGVPKCGITRN